MAPVLIVLMALFSTGQHVQLLTAFHKIMPVPTGADMRLWIVPSVSVPILFIKPFGKSCERIT